MDIRDGALLFTLESQMYGGLGAGEPTRTAPGFSSIYRAKTGGVRFADLLRHVSEVDPEIRVRFTSPHPKDFPQEVLHLIAERPNICSHLHLPAQCGSSKVLADMRRGYTREAYLDLVADVRRIIPDVTLSSDFIAGFCGETDEEFEETLSLIKEVQYHRLYVYPYSMREVKVKVTFTSCCVLQVSLCPCRKHMPIVT